ncbi:MAG: nucleotidyltransferase domain-containing protein [Chlamydiae bacterium]|nr:nucleotidyltransferase domain-containing protein [Chlamydiota bacterium]MBI3277976.1 nucleotidyltransferase domain-containing protein [Chlamydiota bacterium]
MNSEKIEKEVSVYFKRRPRTHLVAVYLYGSFAKSQQNRWSDIDMGLLYERGKDPSYRELVQMKMELSEKFNRDVDLVNLDEVSPILKHQVIKYGKCLMVKKPRIAQEFFIRALNEYFDLKQVRLPVEKALVKWSIYD